MSFLKFWRKDKHADANNQREDAPPLDPEAEKRRLKHSLSISRSGRYKQRKRERGQILDKPELFNGQSPPSGDRNPADASQSQPSNTNASYVTGPPRNSSPRNHCRDVNHSRTARNMRIGQPVVT